MMNSQAPLRVLFILDSFPDPNAGTEGQFWRLIQHLDRSKIEPAIVLLRRSEFLERELRGIPLRVLNIERIRNPRSIWRIIATAFWAWRAGYKVAHIFFNDSSMVFPPFLKIAGLKVIVSRRDLGFWYTPANLRVLRFVARFVDRVVANCLAVRRAVIEAEGFGPGKIEVIYNAVEPPGRNAIAVDRRQFGIPEEAPLAVVVANLRPLKRVADVVEAIIRLRRTVDSPAHLLVIGEDRPGLISGSHMAELKSTARDGGVADRLHFSGKVANAWPLINMSDVCLLCSETEGLSNTVIEYMLAGKPVICTRVGGNVELVEDGKSGLLVAPGDVDHLTSALGRLLSDKQYAATLGREARRKACREFSSAPEMTGHYQRMYSSLCRS